MRPISIREAPTEGGGFGGASTGSVPVVWWEGKSKYLDPMSKVSSGCRVAMTCSVDARDVQCLSVAVAQALEESPRTHCDWMLSDAFKAIRWPRRVDYFLPTRAPPRVKSVLLYSRGFSLVVRTVTGYRDRHKRVGNGQRCCIVTKVRRLRLLTEVEQWLLVLLVFNFSWLMANTLSSWVALAVWKF